MLHIKKITVAKAFHNDDNNDGDIFNILNVVFAFILELVQTKGKAA